MHAAQWDFINESISNMANGDYLLAEKFDIQTISAKAQNSEYVNLALADDISSALNIICINLLVCCPVPLYRSAPKMTIFRPALVKIEQANPISLPNSQAKRK